MRKIFLLLCLFLKCFVYAQQSTNLSIDWIENTGFIFGENKLNIPQFSSDSFNFDYIKKEISFVKKFPVNSYVDENSLQVSNLVYESISESQLGDLSKKSIKSSLHIKLKNVTSRDKIFAMLTFSPFIKDEGGYKKVKSFSYTYKNSTNNSKFNCE